MTVYRQQCTIYTNLMCLSVGHFVNTCVRVERRVSQLISGSSVGVHWPIYLRLSPPSPQKTQLKGYRIEKQACLVLATTRPQCSNYKVSLGCTLLEELIGSYDVGIFSLQCKLPSIYPHRTFKRLHSNQNIGIF